LLRVSETGSFDRFFRACRHACCIAPKALPGQASAEIRRKYVISKTAKAIHVLLRIVCENAIR